MSYDISVIIPTYNRAEELAKTLKGMVAMDMGQLSVEFVIVDNGSTDRTKSIVKSFCGTLTVRYLFEGKHGKSRALNRALEKGNLGNIVVFTDDDVDVKPDWLLSIHSVCERWPKHSVFGGQIDVIYPTEDIPEWASHPYMRSLGFAYHKYAEKECIYEGGGIPIGPNYWVRRDVFDDHRCFNEAIGPHPTNRILGDETLFLLGLLNSGYQIVYSPTAVVGHRIQPEVLKLSGICRRAYQSGRSSAYIVGLAQHELLDQHPAVWRGVRFGGIMWNISKVLFSAIFSSNRKRVFNVSLRIRDLGHQFESLRLAKKSRGHDRFPD